MKFLYPQVLWALFLLVIPIIIHLFNFKRYKTIYFSSLQFVKHVDQQTRSTKKLKHYLVLASRLLALTFLILAFAQPINGTDKNTSGAVGNLNFIYVDNSFSMQALGPEGELLSEAKEKAREIIQSSGMDATFIIATNGLNGLEERILTKADAFERVDKLSYSPLRRTLQEILEWQENVLSKNNGTATPIKGVKNFLLSDFQRINCAAEIKPTASFSYFPIYFKPEKTSNIFIDSVWFEEPVQKLGEKNTLNVQVVNRSENDLQNLEVEFQVGKVNRVVFMDVKANAKAQTSITFQNKSVESIAGKIMVADNSVFFDDTYYLSYQVEKSANVLVLNAEDGVANVAIPYDLDTYYKLSKIELTAVTKDDLADKDLIIINGANNLSSGIITYVDELLSTGSTVVLFPGRSPQLGNWNGFLSDHKMGLFGPGISSGTRIKSINYEDPFFSGVFDTKPASLNLPSVTKTFSVSGNTGSGTSLIELQNGLSLLEYSEREGKLFVFYSSLHPDFGQLTNDALFSTMILRMGELSKRKRPIALTIGNEATFPVYQSLSRDAVIRLKGNELDFIPDRSETAGVNYLSLSTLSGINELFAGNYEINSEKKIGNLSLNYNRDESTLDALSKTEVEALFDVPGVNVKLSEFSSDSNFSVDDLDKPVSYWKICIVLSLIFVLSEMFLVRFLK